MTTQTTITKSKTCPVCGQIVKRDNGQFMTHVSYNIDLKFETVCPASGKYPSEIKVEAKFRAARKFAIRLMSFTGTGLVRGNWTGWRRSRRGQAG